MTTALPTLSVVAVSLAASALLVPSQVAAVPGTAPAQAYRSGTYYFIPKATAAGWQDGCDYAVEIQIKGSRVRKTGTVAYGACHAEWTNGWVRISKGKVRGGCVPYHPVLQYKCDESVFPPTTGDHAMTRVSRATALAAYPDSTQWTDYLEHVNLPWE